MRLVLEVCSGPEVGRSIASVGEVRRVGRGATADEPVADGYLSEVHFAVYWHDGVPWVRDLGSRNGTFVNRVAVTETPLRDGDQLFAGQTTFAVRLEPEVAAVATPPEIAPTGEPEPALDLLEGLRSTPRDCARWILRAQPGYLFALLDLARDERVLELLADSGERFQVFDDDPEVDDLADTAPCLVALPRDSDLLADLLDEGWAQRWGVFLTSEHDFDVVCEHLEHLLAVGVRRGEPPPVLQDPDALRELLPRCDAAEAEALFGPVSAFLAESDDPDVLVRYARSPDGVEGEEFDLALELDGGAAGVVE